MVDSEIPGFTDTLIDMGLHLARALNPFSF